MTLEHPSHAIVWPPTLCTVYIVTIHIPKQWCGLYLSNGVGYCAMAWAIVQWCGLLNNVLALTAIFKRNLVENRYGIKTSLHL